MDSEDLQGDTIQRYSICILRKSVWLLLRVPTAQSHEVPITLRQG